MKNLSLCFSFRVISSFECNMYVEQSSVAPFELRSSRSNRLNVLISDIGIFIAFKRSVCLGLSSVAEPEEGGGGGGVV